MNLTVPLDQDYHVHSTFSDGASTAADNVAVARDRGLRRLCLTDHVRSATTWLPDFVAAVAALRADEDVIEALVDATAAALITLPGRPVLLAHLFSILPRVVAGSDSHDCVGVGVFPSVRQRIDAVVAAGSR